MKATELMIGDWIKVNDTPIKVDTIGREEGIGSNDIAKYRFTDFSPIPLTVEILEDNGFKKEGKHLWNIYEGISIDPSFTLGEVVEDGQLILFKYSPFSIRYVHELQHALRLLGLNTLADNFKI